MGSGFSSLTTINNIIYDNSLLSSSFMTLSSSFQNLSSSVSQLTGSINSQILFWGNNSVGATTVTRYLTPGYSDNTADPSAISYILPRNGKLKNFYVKMEPHGNGNNIVFTLRKNELPTLLSITISSTTQSNSNLVNEVNCLIGDIIDIEVTKPLSIGATPNKIIATMEIIY